MNCQECGIELASYPDESDSSITYYLAKDFKLFSMITKYQIPFSCKSCGALRFKYQAIRDIVFIWPDPLKDKIGSIIIPDFAKRNDDYGVVISTGKGCYDKKGKIFIPAQLKIGDYVVYDKNVPWEVDVLGNDDKIHSVKYMGEQDVKGIIVEEK